MTDTLTQLHGNIADRTATIGVVGLGYVGLPLAASFARAGFTVVGVDLDSDRIAAINAGRSPIEGDEPGLADLLSEVTATGRLRATSDYTEVSSARIVTINVQTPVGSDNQPDFTALLAAAHDLGRVLESGSLVIVESTVSPGTTESLVKSALESHSGMTEGRDFYLGACPERVMPGKLLANLREVPRVCGGSSPDVAAAMRALYRTIVDAEVDTASTTTAELVKVTENAYRDVQIAFANEVALICRDLGEDVWRVRELVNKVPERNMHRPGGGVGGHCIPKDPWLLAAAATSSPRLISAARQINDGMPGEIGRMVLQGSKALAASAENHERASRVLILGYSYLPESDDTRNSPSESLAKRLKKEGLEVLIHDPWVPGLQIDLDEAFSTSGVAVTMVHHHAYKSLPVTVPFHIDACRLADAATRLDDLLEMANA